MRANVFTIGLEKDQALTCLTLHFLGTLAHAVAHTRRAALDLARAGHAEPLFGPAVGLHLRHFVFLCSSLLLLAAGHVYGSCAPRKAVVKPAPPESKRKKPRKALSIWHLAGPPPLNAKCHMLNASFPTKKGQLSLTHPQDAPRRSRVNSTAIFPCQAIFLITSQQKGRPKPPFLSPASCPLLRTLNWRRFFCGLHCLLSPFRLSCRLKIG